jgi:squalene-hopene/tetraprenyl-beta-curcumene cyclase
MDDTIVTSLDGAPRDEFGAKLGFAIERAQRWLLDRQHPEGYWQAALEANGEMNAEFIIFNRFMGVEPEPALDAKLKKHLLDIQKLDGSWTLFPGGEGHLSTTIEVYFALKLAGMRAGDEPMMQCRRWVLAQGGIAQAGTLARFYLAAMNQVPWNSTPMLPVEIALLPSWFPVNMYELSSWARGTLFALMVMQAQKPAATLDWRQGILELYVQPPHFTKFKMPRGDRLLSLRNALLLTDKLLRYYDRNHWPSLRTRALRLGRHSAMLSAHSNGAQSAGLSQ